MCIPNGITVKNISDLQNKSIPKLVATSQQTADIPINLIPKVYSANTNSINNSWTNDNIMMNSNNIEPNINGNSITYTTISKSRYQNNSQDNDLLQQQIKTEIESDVKCSISELKRQMCSISETVIIAILPTNLLTPSPSFSQNTTINCSTQPPPSSKSLNKQSLMDNNLHLHDKCEKLKLINEKLTRNFKFKEKSIKQYMEKQIQLSEEICQLLNEQNEKILTNSKTTYNTNNNDKQQELSIDFEMELENQTYISKNIDRLAILTAEIEELKEKICLLDEIEESKKPSQPQTSLNSGVNMQKVKTPIPYYMAKKQKLSISHETLNEFVNRQTSSAKKILNNNQIINNNSNQNNGIKITNVTSGSNIDLLLKKKNEITINHTYKELQSHVINNVNVSNVMDNLGNVLSVDGETIYFSPYDNNQINAIPCIQIPTTHQQITPTIVQKNLIPPPPLTVKVKKILPFNNETIRKQNDLLKPTKITKTNEKNIECVLGV